MNYYIDLQSKIAEEQGFIFERVLIDSKEQAMVNPSPFTIYSLFYKGKFITHELTAEKKFLKIILAHIILISVFSSEIKQVSKILKFFSSNICNLYKNSKLSILISETSDFSIKEIRISIPSFVGISPLRIF